MVDDPLAGEPTLPADTSNANTPTVRVPRRAAAVGGYELGDVLGRGGMGEVVAAHDPRIEREVALKRMRGDAQSPDAIARFIREAKIQARLDHPAIVPVHELGHDADGLPYFTMKRLAGTTLAQRLVVTAGATAGAGRAPQPLLRAFADVCFAIDLAHSHGVVHRDLKPSNIMLGDYGEVYVLDWGIARVVDRPPHRPSAMRHAPAQPARAGDDPAPAVNLPLDASLPDGTAIGMLLGTPGYMAPEQVRGDAVGTPADVYALGAILFEILAGQPVHPPGSAAIASTLEGRAGLSPAARAPSRQLAPELDALCVAALAEDAAKRPTARELATRVQAYLDGDRDLEQRRRLAAASLAEAREREATGERVEALRAAGRAVALDPESREAAELATALILTPPREIPPEALRELAVTDRAIDRARGLRGARAYLLIWVMVPVALFLRHVTNWTELAVLIGGGTAMAGLVRLHVAELVPSWLLIIANIAFGVLFERIGGPFVLTPIFACCIAMAVGTQRRRAGRRWWPFLVVALIIALPFGLELAGVIERTWRMTPDGLLVHSAVFGSRDATDIAGFVLGTIALGIVCVGYALALDRNQRAAQREAAVQAWHLKQLLRRRE